jgi:hypothetical protein
VEDPSVAKYRYLEVLSIAFRAAMHSSARIPPECLHFSSISLDGLKEVEGQAL